MGRERLIAFEAARTMERAAEALRSGKTEWALHVVTQGARETRAKLRRASGHRGYHDDQRRQSDNQDAAHRSTPSK